MAAHTPTPTSLSPASSCVRLNSASAWVTEERSGGGSGASRTRAISTAGSQAAGEAKGGRRERKGE